jgi:cytidylate kinase
LTLAISREAGARGTSIARKVGEQLGWQVFDQQTLDYLQLDETGRAQLMADVPQGARAWAEDYLARLQFDGLLNPDAETVALVRIVFVVAARGEVVIVGRGAGFLLPVESTIHARVIAPLDERVNFFAQTHRMTREEATHEVRARDDRRAKFLAWAVRRDPANLTGFDLVVNSTRLGVEGSSQLIGWAVRTKQMLADIAAQSVSTDSGEFGPA